jgi:uncharacterized membrane protein
VWWGTITSWDRVAYVVALVLAMPLSLLGWRWLLAGFPVLAANVLSLHWYQYRIQSHYTASLIVIVVVAAAYGAARFDGFGRTRFRRPVLAGVAIVAIALWIIAGPITVWAPAHDHPDRITSMLELIPDDASVSAATTFTPQLANREDVYVFPNPWIVENYGTATTEPPDPSTVEWVAVRLDVDVRFEGLIDLLVSTGDFEIVHEDLPFLLLHRTTSG